MIVIHWKVDFHHHQQIIGNNKNDIAAWGFQLLGLCLVWPVSMAALTGQAAAAITVSSFFLYQTLIGAKFLLS